MAPFSAADVTHFFLHNILLRHGAPRILLGDRGARASCRRSFPTYFNASGTFRIMASSYHTQTNGLTERFHRTLSDMLSMYVQPDHRNWDTLLTFVTCAFNTAVQNTTGYYPTHSTLCAVGTLRTPRIPASLPLRRPLLHRLLNNSFLASNIPARLLACALKPVHRTANNAVTRLIDLFISTLMTKCWSGHQLAFQASARDFYTASEALTRFSR